MRGFTFLFFLIFSTGNFMAKNHILVIDNGMKANSNLKKYLDDRKIDYLIVDKNSDLNSILKNKIIGIIFSGGPLLYSQKNINLEQININIAALLNFNCPILGVCFGHQTLVKAFGGEISKMKNPVEGLEEIQITKDAKIFNGLPKNVQMKQNHNDCATKVPDIFEVIATSRSCAVEGIRHKSKPIFGIQFHPESSGDAGYKLLDNFMELCNNFAMSLQTRHSW